MQRWNLRVVSSIWLRAIVRLSPLRNISRSYIYANVSFLLAGLSLLRCDCVRAERLQWHGSWHRCKSERIRSVSGGQSLEPEYCERASRSEFGCVHQFHRIDDAAASRFRVGAVRRAEHRNSLHRRERFAAGEDQIHGIDESDPGPMPIPANAPVEGYPNPGKGDRHVLVLDRDN